MTIEDVLKLSPPLLLAFAINLVLLFLKPLVPERHRGFLPFSAMVLGAVLYPCVAEEAAVSYSVPSPRLFNVVMGACIGGMAVALHQTFKQILKKVAGTEDTTTFSR